MNGLKSMEKIIDTADKLLDNWDVEVVERLTKEELVYMVAYLVGMCREYKRKAEV